MHFEQIFSDPTLNQEDTVISSYLNAKCHEPDSSSSDILLQQVTLDELVKCNNQLKRRKSPGIDNILNEHLIYGGPALHHAIQRLFNIILATENIPRSWKTSIIIPLYK